MATSMKVSGRWLIGSKEAVESALHRRGFTSSTTAATMCSRSLAAVLTHGRSPAHHAGGWQRLPWAFVAAYLTRSLKTSVSGPVRLLASSIFVDDGCAGALSRLVLLEDRQCSLSDRLRLSNDGGGCSGEGGGGDSVGGGVAVATAVAALR